MEREAGLEAIGEETQIGQTRDHFFLRRGGDDLDGGGIRSDDGMGGHDARGNGSGGGIGGDQIARTGCGKMSGLLPAELEGIARGDDEIARAERRRDEETGGALLVNEKAEAANENRAAKNER